MICAPAAGVRLSEWERGIGMAESTARTAQMITTPKGKLGVCAGKQGGLSLHAAQPHPAI